MSESRLMQSMLLDFYGELITEKQRECFDLHYNEDLSLSEIAENYGISRQGVRDVIVRAEAAMTELEDKTGILKRFMRLKDKIAAIAEDAEAIKAINYRQYDNDELAELAERIAANAAALRE